MDWLSLLMGIILGCVLGVGFVGFIAYNQIMEASIEIGKLKAELKHSGVCSHIKKARELDDIQRG